MLGCSFGLFSIYSTFVFSLYRPFCFVITFSNSASPAASQIRRMLGSNAGQLRLRHWLSDTLTTQLDFIHTLIYLMYVLYMMLFLFGSFYFCTISNTNLTLTVFSKAQKEVNLSNVTYCISQSKNLQSSAKLHFHIQPGTHFCYLLFFLKTYCCTDALTTRLDLIHSIGQISSTTRLDLIHTRLDLIYCTLGQISSTLGQIIHTRLDLIHTKLDLIHNWSRSHPRQARSHPQLGQISSTLQARSHPQLGQISSTLGQISSTLGQISSTLGQIIHTRLDLIHTKLDLIHNWSRSHPHQARSHPQLGQISSTLGYRSHLIPINYYGMTPRPLQESGGEGQLRDPA